MKKSLIIIGIVVVIILGAIGIKVLIDNNSEEEVQTGKVTTNLKNANEKLKIASKNMTLDGKTTGYSSANPVIPKGFKTVDTESAKWVYIDNNKQVVQGWNDGLVIEDEKGNQFVWVPCNLDSEV